MTKRLKDIPFSVPESLASYLVQFDGAPDKTIRRLKTHLQKRGPDPVGYFVLGWLYYRKGQGEKAVQAALKAKNYAPGSPFIQKVHYFFSHPHLFEAWQHADDQTTISDNRLTPAHAPIEDLDRLIEKLSAIDTKRMKNDDAAPSNEGSELSNDSGAVDNIVSETLAEIHEQQGKLQAAIKTYKKLLEHGGRSSHYRKQIERLEKMIEEKEGE